jgi:hypothetical protein
MVRRRIAALFAALLALVFAAPVFAAPVFAAPPAGSALAVGPVRLTSSITDQTGAVAARRPEVQASINQLYAQYRIKLYVVYVATFSGLSPTSWVDRTAVLNGLGTRDILMGVATSARNYAISTDPSTGLSRTQVDSVSSVAIEPALRQGNWAGAAIGAAHGFGAAVAGQPIPAAPVTPAGAPAGPPATAPHHPASGASPAPTRAFAPEGAAIAIGLVVLLGLMLLAGRRLARGGAREGGRGGRRRGVGGGHGHGHGHGPPAGPTTAELEAQASSALVQTDDAVRTSEQELGFAVARFGEHAAAPFSAALKGARAELAAAFKLRQLLDDDVPEPEHVERSMLTEISGRCAEANRLLDEQSEAFDRLQDLEARAPEMVAEVDNHVTQQDQRLTRSVQTLQQLAARYTPAAVAVAATSPDQARERLEFARGGVSEARRALATDDSGKAAVFLQAAESAADQAESLLDGIEHLEAELTQAASGLQAALREIDTDIAEGTALLASLPGDRSALVARAQDTASAVRAEMAAGQPFDALGALRALEQADAALDQALSGVREERERQERARAVLDQAMLVARSSMTAAGDFITTRRGGVGAEARTRLAEAQRHFQQAIAAARGDPEAALAEAQHADALAQQARSLAERDVEHFTYAEPGRVVRTGGLGGFGGGLGGAVLGGILIDSMLGGGRRGWGGAGWGGAGWGAGGGLGLGSFGGAGTRARHSIGGMF